MTRQLLFIQGGGAGVHDGWDEPLAASLRRALGPGWEVRYPRMPDEADPTYAAWSAAIAAAIGNLDPGAVVAGHSIGGTVLVHALAARPLLLDGLAAVVLIAAPYVGDGGWPADGIEAAPGWAAPLSDMAVRLYHGSADDTVPPAHLDLYAAALPNARRRLLEGRDHQLNGDLGEVAADLVGMAGQG